MTRPGLAIGAAVAMVILASMAACGKPNSALAPAATEADGIASQGETSNSATPFEQATSGVGASSVIN